MRRTEVTVGPTGAAGWPGAVALRSLPQRVDSLFNFKSFFFLEGCGKPLSF